MLRFHLVTTPCINPIAWTPPIGIAFLAAALKEIGVSVQCFDFNPQTAGFCFDNREYHNLDVKAGANAFPRQGALRYWSNQLLAERPHVIGLSVLYNSMLRPSVALAQEIKERSPETIVVMGGPVFLKSNSRIIEQILQTGWVDLIAEGEGEMIVKDIAIALEEAGDVKNISGVWAADERGAVKRIPPRKHVRVNINSIHMPDFSYFNLNEYEGMWGYFPLFMSRGCVNNCAFCNSRKNMPGFRQRSAELMFEEYIRNIELYGAKRFAFMDNLINGNIHEFKKFLKMLKKAGMKYRTWAMPAFLPNIDEEFIDLLGETGFQDILLALETPATNVRKSMRKWGNKEQVLKILRMYIERGIKPQIYLMHSFPTETEKDFQEILGFFDEFSPSSFRRINFWPFCLAGVTPGDYSEDFIRSFDLKVHPDQVYYDWNMFSPEPNWESDFVCAEVRENRQKRLLARHSEWWAKEADSDKGDPKKLWLTNREHWEKKLKFYDKLEME